MWQPGRSVSASHKGAQLFDLCLTHIGVLSRRGLAVAAAFLALLFLPTLALAHSQLISSNPRDGAVVAAAPEAFTLTFNEPVSPIAIKLARPDGSVMLIETVKVAGETVVLTPPAGLANGSYALSYRVISEDGHPVGGTIVFSIGAPSAGASRVMDDATPQASRLMILAQRVALYLGLFLGVGGAFAVNWIGAGQREGVAAVRVFLGLGLVASVLGIGLQGLDMLAVSPAALLSSAPWREGLKATYAVTLGLAALAMFTALLALSTRGGLARALALPALLLVGLSVAASGHASAADPQWLMRPAVFAHAVSVAIWIGALLPLGRALRRGGVESAAMLARFSRAILPVIALLIASGVVLAVVQVRKVEALWTTDYGIVFAAKLVMLVGLFAAGAVNRAFLTAPALSGLEGRLTSDPLTAEDAAVSLPRKAKALRVSIVLEVLLVLAILVTVANWRFTAPPRALQLAARQAVAVEVMSDKAMANVTIFPATTGPVMVTVAPMAHGTGELTVKELSVIMSNPAAGIEPIRRKAELDDDGDYVVEGVRLPVPGRWHIRIEILISDFEMTTPEGEVQIRQ
ncbi:copper resistance CopC/CopD family protein [Rhizobium sp. C4]|uniref:copper resistance CopC/CopD family protein n=1 Tax=Rhizobium sp. C4 TaxID=1349800 RepID=UPI001E2EBC9D|nr:copper resistance protein CopC [Rhizobium sp. C4]MCD2175552.1 copper resistance protein CopC [Rhizobium sp. C4]